MGARQQLRGSLIGAYLGGRFAALRRRAHRVLSSGVEVYLQIDDPYSHLLVQVVADMVAQVPIDVELVVVPPPSLPFDPEPQLRLRYAMADAADIATRSLVDFPAEAASPTASRIALANGILLQERPFAEQIEVTRSVGRAFWSAADAELEALRRRHGAVLEGQLEPLLARNAGRLRRRGHYQGGSLRFAGEWFVGWDRLTHLEGLLRREGLDAVLRPRRRPDRPSSEGAAAADGEREVDLYFSFRSPYSYLAVDRVARVAQQHGASLRIKPVLPMVTRGYAVPLAKRLYIVRDSAREARRMGIPFGRICDPLGVGVERCMALFHYAELQGHGLAFVSSAARGIWSEALDMSQDDDLAHVVQRAGLSWTKARPSLEDDTWRDRAERNRHELRALGLWGVPSFRVGDWACWGQDRLDRVAERLCQVAPASPEPPITPEPSR